MISEHKFSLDRDAIKRDCPGGNRILASNKTVAAFHGMAIATIHLKKGALREPHWHPNANELTYCVRGQALITLFSPGNIHDTFTLREGEVAYFPKGCIHHIENIDQEDSYFILAYDHSCPEDFNLSDSVSSMSTDVLADTFNISANRVRKIKENGKNGFIVKRKTLAKPTFSSIANPHKIHLEKMSPQIATPYGVARIANRQSFPLLNGLSLFSLRLFKGAVREPHWHPNATELNYVITGKAKLTIFSPNGKRERFELSPNEGSIIPTGYFHSIENIGKGPLHMAVFFNHAEPNDIGLSGALSAYAPEVLAAIFSVEPKVFSKWATIQEDLMVVAGGG